MVALRYIRVWLIAGIWVYFVHGWGHERASLYLSLFLAVNTFLVNTILIGSDVDILYTHISKVEILGEEEEKIGRLHGL